jgi:hypothetical protein
VVSVSVANRLRLTLKDFFERREKDFFQTRVAAMQQKNSRVFFPR